MSLWTDELPALAALSDQDVADAINAKTTTERASQRITYRDVLAVIRDPAKLEAIAAGIKTSMPTIDGMLSDYSGESVPRTRSRLRRLSDAWTRARG